MSSLEKQSNNEKKENQVSNFNIMINNTNISKVENEKNISSITINETARNSILFSSKNFVPKCNLEPYEYLKDEDDLISSTSPKETKHFENFEDIISNRSNLKKYTSVKEITGKFPILNSQECTSFQVHERNESNTEKLKALTEVKKLSLVGDGIKVTKTACSSNVKCSPGYRVSASSLLLDNISVRDFKYENTYKKIIDDSEKRIERFSHIYVPYEKNKIKLSSYKQSFFSFVSNNNNNNNNDVKTAMTSSFYDKIHESYLYPGIMSQIRSTPTSMNKIPPTFSNEIEDIFLRNGGTAYFKGIVNGSFPFDIIWLIENRIIEKSSRIETNLIESTSFFNGLIDYIISLKINECTVEDIGKYSVYVKNEAGDASCSAFLIIEGKKEIEKDFKNGMKF
jgi:hypothetical protein